MHSAAIITVPSRARFPQVHGTEQRIQPNLALPAIAHWDVLGKSVIERIIDRLEVFGVAETSVISEYSPETAGLHGSSATVTNNFWNSWEQTVSRYLQFALKTLLLLRVGTYAEIDVAEFLRFHHETNSSMTQVYDQTGALDFVAVDAHAFRTGTGTFRSRLRGVIPHHQRFDFGGYSNRLSTVGDYWQLIQDAVAGRAALRPMGREIQPNVWMGDGARVESSARISGSLFLGKNSRIAAGCSMAGTTVIGAQCEIDCGTSVSDSCILPGTYVGAGLKIQNGVAIQDLFFNLRRNVQLQFSDRRLFGKTSRFRGMFNKSWSHASRSIGQLSLQ